MPGRASGPQARPEAIGYASTLLRSDAITDACESHVTSTTFVWRLASATYKTRAARVRVYPSRSFIRKLSFNFNINQASTPKHHGASLRAPQDVRRQTWHHTY